MIYDKIIKIRNFINKSVTKIIFYLTGIVFMIFYTKVKNGYDTVMITILSIIENDATISVFTVGLFAMGIKYVTHWINSNLEESNKTEADHRKIIKQYNGHDTECKPGFSQTGAYLKIYSPNLDMSRIHKNPVKDKLSKSYENWEKTYSESKFPRCKEEINKENPDGVLCLSSISVFANNINNKPEKIVIFDENKRYSLPQYIHMNAHNLLAAHSTTTFKNNETTIRLRDASFEDNKLNLYTERSTYYEMLMTNRCMDFEHSPHLTLRQVYEFKSRINKLCDSQFSNQIGINGLVITKDGYALIEKRDLSKSTWKNKFSQPISLAMKQESIKEFLVDDKINTDDAQDIFLKIISKTLLDNYGLKYAKDGSGDYEFSICSNLIGLARDLLEGGKPNLYFCVVLNMTAQKLKEKMEKYASIADRESSELKPLSDDKLKSDFYLIHRSLIKVDYDYSMALRQQDRATKNDHAGKKSWMYINRIQSPRSSRFKVFKNKLAHSLYWRLNKEYRRECSEALLVCISYMQIYNNKNNTGDK